MKQNIYEIAPDHITVDGYELAVEWSVSSTGRSVYGFYTLEGERFRVPFTGECGELFTAALEAAKRGNTTQVDGDGLWAVLGTAQLLQPRKQPAPINPECPEGAEPASAAKQDAGETRDQAERQTRGDADKQRHGEVPEKWFIGQALEGKSWRIVFDGDAGKTRVIFPRKPSSKVLEAVKAAGFYWSPALKSWNKGLNFRAYRAAEKLHAELHKLAA